MKRIDFVHFLEVLQAMRKIDLSSRVASGATLKKFQDMAYKIGGSRYVDILKQYNINSPEAFSAFISDEDFKSQMENDRVGKSILSKIIFAKRHQIEAEMKAIEKKFQHALSEDINDVEDYDNTFVLREKDGEGPIVFAELHNPEDINTIKTWYAYRYGINYLKVSPCTFEFWINHPDRQNFSNKDMVRQYKEEHSTDEMLVTENETSVPSFNRGDMVEDEKGQGYVVIDTFTTEEEIAAAKKKRPYRVILPKDYVVSDETPVVAVMTIKAVKRGLNYIYPISKFSMIGAELDECDTLDENAQVNESMKRYADKNEAYDDLQKILDIFDAKKVVTAFFMAASLDDLNYIIPGIIRDYDLEDYISSADLNEDLDMTSEVATPEYDSYVLVDNSDFSVIGTYYNFDEAKHDADYYAHRNVHGSFSVCGCINDEYECDPDADDNTIVYTADFEFVR